MKISRHNFFSLFLLLCAVFSHAEIADSLTGFLNEAQVFEWWDDGLITGEEAEEILSRIQEENFAEACHLAEVLALETCAPRKKTRENEKAAGRESPRASSYVVYNSRMDSAGDVRSHDLDLDVKFYRFQLHLGSRGQLSYKREGAEAYFGQIAAREFYSQIGTDTLWGVAVRYPLGRWLVQAALDTAKNLQGGFGFKSKDFTASAALWYRPEGDPSAESAIFQLKIPEGEGALWWQRGQDTPLVRLRLQKSFRKKDSLRVSWQTTAIIHGSEIPDQAYLSGTYAKNKFTGTQAIALSVPTRFGFREMLPWMTRLNVNARVFSPLATDSLKARIKLQAETGPEVFRANGSLTCREAADRCREKDVSLKLSSRFFSDVTLGASLQSRHTRGEGFGVPRTEGAVTYQPAPQLISKIVMTLPRGAPGRHLQVRTENFLESGHVQGGLVVTFRRKHGEKFHPIRGNLQVKWLF